MICHTCKRAFSDEELRQKSKQKSDRIKEARRLAKSCGEQVGASRIYDRDKIMELRNQGLSIRKIAKLMQCSISPVIAALKELADASGDK